MLNSIFLDGGQNFIVPETSLFRQVIITISKDSKNDQHAAWDYVRTLKTREDHEYYTTLREH